ncbi:MAG: TatD family hydrolase [Verrucomicrobia bacterium]|nr:TatD family hydrolase [Verrucomicrobiota bacterium]
MELIDTHAHLNYPDFEPDLDGVVARACEAGVKRIITIGTGLESSRRAVALTERFPNVYAAIGIHPTNVMEEGLDFLPALTDLARHPKVVAIGETGIDYYHVPEELRPAKVASVDSALLAQCTGDQERLIAEGAWKAAQADAFRMQLDLAVELGLNVVIHQRSSWVDTLDALRDYTGKVRGVFHCFGGTPEEAAELAALGHLVSFTGIITFKNAEQVRLTAAAVPSDGYMVETDCPYLAPVPHRGKRAEPAHTRLVAETIAGVRGVSLEEIATETTSIAEKFFRFQRS